MQNHPNSNKTAFQDLNIEDIKSCEEFKNMSDEIAEQLAEAIRVFTEIIYKCYMENRFEEQKAKVIELKQKEAKKAA
jgi:hypothetical protein